MSDIFLSYASEDQDRVKALVEQLQKQGWSVFWDRTIPTGKTWREIIGKELAEAHCVVVVWSETSIQSSWVQEEADEGRERGILIPIRIDDVKPPMGFRSFQAATLVEWNGKETSGAFQMLLADLKTILGPPAPGAVDPGTVDSELSNNGEAWREQGGHDSHAPKSDRSEDIGSPGAASHRAASKAMRLTVIGWAFGGAAALAVGFNIGPMFGLAFGGALAWCLGGMIGGFATGRALRLMEQAVGKQQVSLIMIGFAAGGAAAGALSWEFGSAVGGFIGGGVGGAIGGVFTGYCLREVKPSIPWSQVGIIAFGWGIGGGLGGALSFAFLGYLYTTIFYAIVGAVTGAVIGAVGGTLMFRSLRP